LTNIDAGDLLDSHAAGSVHGDLTGSIEAHQASAGIVKYKRGSSIVGNHEAPKFEHNSPKVSKAEVEKRDDPSVSLAQGASLDISEDNGNVSIEGGNDVDFGVKADGLPLGDLVKIAKQGSNALNTLYRKSG